jgi:WD40 repeat protein
MVQCMGRSKRSESKGRLLTGWWKGTFGLIALLGLLMGVMVAQVKPPERERLLERRDGRERLFERMQGGRSPNSLFRSPAGSFTSRSRQFSEELVWFKPLLDPGVVVFSPDGQFLASPKRGGGIGIFRVSDGTLVRTLTGHTDVVTSVAFSPDGNLIASGSWDKTIKTWRVSDGSLVRTLTGHTGGVISVAFSPDGNLIASGSDDNTIKIWRVSDGTLVRTLTGHMSEVTSVAFSPDGSLIASGSLDRTIKIWRVSDGTLVRTLTGHTSGVYSVAFSPDGSLIASASGDDRTINIWQVSDGTLVRTLTGHMSGVTSVAFSPDGNLIASGSWDKTINIWQVSDGTLVRTLTGHTGGVTSVTFSPDGNLIASGSEDKTINIWQVSDGTLVRTLTWYTHLVSSVAFSPDRNLIASGSLDSTIKIWRVSDGTLVRTLTGHMSYVTSVAFSPDRNLIASGSLDSTIKIWRVSDGTLVRTLTGHTSGVTSVAFSPDGNLIASGNYDNTIKIWRVSDGTLVRTLTGHTSGVTSVAFSPDGSLIASGSGWPENTIKIWRVSDGSLVRTLTGHTSWVYSVTFSPDGNLIASGSEDKTIKIWRVSDGTLVRTLTGHTDRVYSVTFSPDGNLIASGSRDETINIWQVSDGSLVRTLTGHTDEVLSVTFSPDGSLIASGGGDGLALWRVGAPTNRPPSIPTLLSPDDGSTVSPTPTFKVKSEDPDGDDVKFVLELRKGDEVKNFETGFVASGSEAVYTVTEELASGQWSWKAKAIDSKGGESEWSGVRSFTVNRTPTVPVLLEPADNTIVSPTPTFKVKSEDPDGDNVKFVLELRKGDEVKNFETGFFASGSEATFTVPSDQALSEGQWSWRARAIDSKGAVSDWSGTRTIQVTLVPLIKSGVRLVACPVIGPTDPKSVFAFDDDKWAWYDPTSGYLLYPNSQTNLQVGKGYWAKFVQDTKPNVKGDLPDATKPFSISLKKGWNLIGNPWLVDLVWDLSSIKVKVGGQEKALKDLGESEGVEPYAWRWDGSNYRLVYDTNVGIIGIDSVLPSWEGAWVYAHTDCELILPTTKSKQGTRDKGARDEL